MKTIPATTIHPAPEGHLGIGVPREPTLDGNEKLVDYLARHGIRQHRGFIFGTVRVAKLLSITEER